MKIQNVTKLEKKKFVMSIRVTPTIRKWIVKNKISPSKVFTEAIEELMEEAKNENQDQNTI